MIGRRIGTIAGALLFVLGLSSTLAGKDEPPVAGGEYRILLGGRRIGWEKFSVFKGKEVEIRSEATLYWPEPTRFELRYRLGPSFQPEELEVEVVRGGRIGQIKLQRRGGDWRSEVQWKGGEKVRKDLGSREGTEVDFESPLFNGFIVRRLSLKPGEERVIPVIVFRLSDLSGRRAEHRYRRLDGGEVETEALGTVDGRAYELMDGETTRQFWTDPSGVVLLMRAELPEGELEHELVQIESKPGAWQPPRD